MQYQRQIFSLIKICLELDSKPDFHAIYQLHCCQKQIAQPARKATVQGGAGSCV